MQTAIQLQEVERLRSEGKLTEAYMLCKHAYDQTPDDIDVLVAMSDLAFDLSHFSVAESLICMALKHDSGRPDLWIQLAQSLSAQSKDAQAQEAEQLSQLDDEAYAAMRMNLAQQQIENGEMNKAIWLLEAIISVSPEHERAAELLVSIKQNALH